VTGGRAPTGDVRRAGSRVATAPRPGSLHDRRRPDRRRRAAAAEEEEPPESAAFERTARAIGLVVAPITLITALLFYVGWVRTFSFFRLFGVNVQLLRYSNQDFMLRSVDSIFHPLGITFALCLLGWWAHAVVRWCIRNRGTQKALRAAGLTLVALGALGVGVGLLTVISPAALLVPTLVTPLLLGLGIVLVAYGHWLLRCLPGLQDPTRRRLPERGSPVELTLLSLLLVLCLFWATSEYVAATARGRAQYFAAGLAREPAVVIYSEKRLFLTGPGVYEESLPDQPNAAYRYRYSGLRLLVESQGRYFLLPAGWRPGAATLMLDHGAGMRIELMASG
jgi:hypothetical protein